MSTSGPVTVREVLVLLRQWRVLSLSGESGFGRSVSWASTMRARLPAFEGFQGGELALLSLATLHALQAQVVELTLPAVVDQLADIGVSAVAVAGLANAAGETATLPPDEVALVENARARAVRLGIALLALPQGTPLGEVERAVIAHVVARREPEPMLEPPDLYAARLRESLRGEALDALLTGTYAGEVSMRSRAAQLGFDLAQPHAVLWVELAMPEEYGTGELALVAERLSEELSVGLGAWARAQDARVAALLPLGRSERGLAELTERTSTLLVRAVGDSADSDGIRWSAGISEPVMAPAQVRHAATEARDAARLGLVVLGPGRVARPGDLGVYRLLLALRDSGDLVPFVRGALAPLLADARTGDALIETLESFFACNGNLSEAARQLHLHRNSLIHRLSRIRELLGHDLDDPELRLSLQLAIKGRRVLEL